MTAILTCLIVTKFDGHSLLFPLLLFLQTDGEGAANGVAESLSLKPIRNQI